MISADLILPQQQVYNFLRSVTIKFSPLAHYINNTLLQNGHVVDTQDPTTWKYYINMTGAYHSSDIEMYVVSLDVDSYQQILFSPETLAVNPRTRQAYQPGGRYYNRLCETYPSQVDLIKSILFPVSTIERAVTSPDFALLAYGNGYLEEWEQPLIVSQLETFLSIFVERWYFDFLDDEPYFYLTAWGSLWYYLAMVIMSARMEYIRTPYVHSWHLWNELEANGIGDYSDILSREQSMMLYQNIDYLKANAGKQSNLIILANNLLSSFGIGLYGRRVVQEAESKASSYQLTPQLIAVRIPTDYGSVALEIPPETVSTVQSQIYSLGLTPSDSAEVVDNVENKLGTTTLNNFDTKFLEIRPIAKNTPYAQTMSNFFIDTLMLCIKEGYYSQNLEVIEPITGTILYMPPSQLMALFHYAIQKSLGISNDHIPTKFMLYESFLPTVGTPVKSFFIGAQEYVITNFVNPTAYLSGLTYNTNISSPTDFSTMTSNLFLRYMDHLIQNQDTILDKKRVVLEYMNSLCHTDREVSFTLVNGFTSYSTWLGSTGINIETGILAQYNFQADSQTAWKNLALAIMTELIPINAIMKNFSDITLSSDEYARLTQLFVALCSYRILFLKSSPENSTFAIGSKWNSVYGPDTVASFGSWTDVRRVFHIDHTLITSEIELHAGFKANISYTVDSEVDYNLTYCTIRKGDEATTHMAQPRVVNSTVSTVVCQGALSLPYTRLTAELINP